MTHRGSSTTAEPKRITGRRLQRIRSLWFARFPLCVHCLERGIVNAATQLDHIVALVNGGKDFDEDDEQNRQGLCDSCHEAKTDEDLGHRLITDNDASGMPTDPRHPWNQSR